MGSPARSEAPAMGGLDNRLIAKIRLVLSSSVLFFIGPADLDASVGAFHILSVLYIAYSVVFYISAQLQIQPLFSRLSYWADVSWSALLIAVSDESSTA